LQDSDSVRSLVLDLDGPMLADRIGGRPVPPDLLQLMGRETANIHLGSRTGEELADRGVRDSTPALMRPRGVE